MWPSVPSCTAQFATFRFDRLIDVHVIMNPYHMRSTFRYPMQSQVWLQLEYRQRHFPIRDIQQYRKLVLPNTQCVLQRVDIVDVLFNIQIGRHTHCIDMRTWISKSLELLAFATPVSKINSVGSTPARQLVYSYIQKVSMSREYNSSSINHSLRALISMAFLTSSMYTCLASICYTYLSPILGINVASL